MASHEGREDLSPPIALHYITCRTFRELSSMSDTKAAETSAGIKIFLKAVLETIPEVAAPEFWSLFTSTMDIFQQSIKLGTLVSDSFAPDNVNSHLGWVEGSKPAFSVQKDLKLSCGHQFQEVDLTAGEDCDQLAVESFKGLEKLFWEQHMAYSVYNGLSSILIVLSFLEKEEGREERLGLQDLIEGRLYPTLTHLMGLGDNGCLVGSRKRRTGKLLTSA